MIEFGFPLDFDRACTLGQTLDNLSSANDYTDQVDKYIQEEIKYKAMLGPFDTPPFNLHISPFMTREKAGLDTRRTIIDLSCPKGLSVNDGVSSLVYFNTDFELKYPSVNLMVNRLNALGPSAKIFKVDISRAFRHVRIDPGDIDLLGLRFRNKYYADLAPPIWISLGIIFFSKLSHSIRYIMAQYGHPYLHNYIDDLLYCCLPSKIHSAYEFLVQLLQELGLDISHKKLRQVLRDHTHSSEIPLDAEFHKDLNWFLIFLTSFNGVTMYDIRPISDHIYLDACLTGLGGCFKNLVYTIPLGFEHYSIVHLEMLNIVVALKIWGSMWRDARIQIHCDNLAVVQVLTSGGSRDPVLSTCASNIWLLSAVYNITIQFSHIAGVQNTVADLLSRWTNSH